MLLRVELLVLVSFFSSLRNGNGSLVSEWDLENFCKFKKILHVFRE
jgi:hypothetical protein